MDEWFDAARPEHAAAKLEYAAGALEWYEKEHAVFTRLNKDLRALEIVADP